MPYEYATGQWRNHIKYSCYDCNYSNLDDKDAAQKHVDGSKHGLSINCDDETFIRQSAGTVPNIHVTLGFLTWNTFIVSAEGAKSLYEEAKRLNQLGIIVNVVILDNGSTDGTYDSLLNTRRNNSFDGFSIILGNRVNEGISKARNRIIEEALYRGSNYLLMLDGDIQVVPFSTFAMTKYLYDHPNVGCIGAYAHHWTQDKKDATRRLYEIPDSRVEHDIPCAWTQYGMFRCAMFQAGMRFDENGPFGEPGWGFEDDDLGFQMVEAGWKNKYFNGMTYLHRNVRSSWPNLTASGVDVFSAFKARKAYLHQKWRSSKKVWPLCNVAMAQRMPETYG